MNDQPNLPVSAPTEPTPDTLTPAANRIVLESGGEAREGAIASDNPSDSVYADSCGGQNNLGGAGENTKTVREAPVPSQSTRHASLTEPGLQAAATAKKAIVPAGERGLTFTDIESMWRFCVAYVNSGVNPKINTPEIALITLQAGLELGLKPVWSLKNIMVLNGQPSVWGDAFLGICQSSPRYSSHDEYFQVKGERREIYEGLTPEELELLETRAVCKFYVNGSDKPYGGSFSVGEAKRAGLWDKRGRNGQLTPWQTYPTRQLQMRARGFAGRNAFAAELQGMKTAEEVLDTPAEQPVKEKPALILPDDNA